MFDLIENLRAKPRHQRRTVAFFISLSLTALIFTTWAFFTLSSFQATLAEEKSTTTTSPLASLRAGFDKAYEAITGELSAFREKINKDFFLPLIYQDSPNVEPFYSPDYSSDETPSE
ncbi:MAG: hypothetical protein G01um1014107_44 [Parcubacteria group bacterium Gr01-1014_107]|nr:MAG: hypothetical protein G01um1014107_44 [Parcubacteria group bacterium Gr01-1014_107]